MQPFLLIGRHMGAQRHAEADSQAGMLPTSHTCTLSHINAGTNTYIHTYGATDRHMHAYIQSYRKAYRQSVIHTYILIETGIHTDIHTVRQADWQTVRVSFSQASDMHTYQYI